MSRMRTCTVCGRRKRLDEMARTGVKGAPDWKRRSYCKTCKSKKNRSGTLRKKIDRLRWQAKRRGFECTLTVADLRALGGQPCTYCGSDQVPSVDRKDSRLGYVAGNCVSACFRCNTLKGDMPLEAWLILVPSVRSAQEAGAFGTWLGRRFPARA